MFNINTEDYVKQGELFDGHFQLLHPLSTDGATADVWLALDTNTIDTEYDEEGTATNGNSTETGMLVAIKIYKPKNALDIEGEQRFRDEYKIVYECRHENLLQPTSFAIYKGIPYLVLPYCRKGSSEQLIGKKLTTEEVWKFISDVASGLAKLHSNLPQIIHQDIKPANILIDNNDNYTITDFGISASTKGSHFSYYDEENSGTLAYMAPERFGANPKPSAESDVWAFGATIHEILTGQPPFGEEGGKNQTEKTAMPSLPSMPASIKNLIHACLQFDPNKRPTAKQIKQAAQSEQFPIKSKTPLIVALCLLGGLIIAGAVFFLKPKQPIPTEPLSIEETFEAALKQMNYNDVDSLKTGMKTMDSLSKKYYVPAMYQMAFTYGWYTDPVSVQRKKLLNIEVDSNNFTIGGYIIKTQALLTDILDQNDSSFAKINADAAYRLASYYGDERLNEHVDFTKASTFLEKSEKWAEYAKNDSIINIITGTKTRLIKRKEEKEHLNPLTIQKAN